MAKNMAIQTLKHAKSAEELQEHLKNMTDEDLQSFYDEAKKIPEDQAYKYEKQLELVEEYMVERGLIKPQEPTPAPQSEMAKGAAVFNKARAVISSGEELELPDEELELLRSYLERMHESLVDHTVENYIAEHFPTTETTETSTTQEQNLAAQKSEATLQTQENQEPATDLQNEVPQEETPNSADIKRKNIEKFRKQYQILAPYLDEAYNFDLTTMESVALEIAPKWAKRVRFHNRLEFREEYGNEFSYQFLKKEEEIKKHIFRVARVCAVTEMALSGNDYSNYSDQQLFDEMMKTAEQILSMELQKNFNQSYEIGRLDDQYILEDTVIENIHNDLKSYYLDDTELVLALIPEDKEDEKTQKQQTEQLASVSQAETTNLSDAQEQDVAAQTPKETLQTQENQEPATDLQNEVPQETRQSDIKTPEMMSFKRAADIALESEDIPQNVAYAIAQHFENIKELSSFFNVENYKELQGRIIHFLTKQDLLSRKDDELVYANGEKCDIEDIRSFTVGLIAVKSRYDIDHLPLSLEQQVKLLERRHQFISNKMDTHYERACIIDELREEFPQYIVKEEFPTPTPQAQEQQVKENQQSDNSTTEKSTIVENENIAPTNVVPENITPTPLPQDQQVAQPAPTLQAAEEEQNAQQEVQAQPQQQVSPKPLSRGEILEQEYMALYTSHQTDKLEFALENLSVDDLFSLHNHIVNQESKGRKLTPEQQEQRKQKRQLRKLVDKGIVKNAGEILSSENNRFIGLDYTKVDNVLLLQDVIKEYQSETTLTSINKHRQEKGLSDISLQIEYFEQQQEHNKQTKKQRKEGKQTSIERFPEYRQWLFEKVLNDAEAVNSLGYKDLIDLIQNADKYGKNVQTGRREAIVLVMQVIAQERIKDTERKDPIVPYIRHLDKTLQKKVLQALRIEEGDMAHEVLFPPKSAQPEPVQETQEQQNVSTEPVVQEQEPEPVVQEPEPVVQEPEPVIQEPKPEPVVQEPEPIAQEQEPEPVVQEPEPLVQEPEPVAQEQEPVVQEPEPVAQEQEPVVQEPDGVAQKFEYEDITKDNIYNLLFEEPETIKQALDAYTPEYLVAFRTWIQEYIDSGYIDATAPQLETFYNIAVEKIVKEPKFAEPDKGDSEKAEIKILLETYSVDFNGKPLDSKSEYKGPYDSLMVAYGAQLSSDALSAPTPEVQITEEDKKAYQALSTMAKDAFDFLSNDRDDLNKIINNLNRFFNNVEITHDEEWRRVGTVAGVRIWDSYTADDLKANVHEMASQQAVLEVLQEYTPDGNGTYISQADGQLIFASDMQEIMREKVLDHMEAQTMGLVSAQMQKEFSDEMLAGIRAQYTADNMPTEKQLQQELQQQIQKKTEDLFNETTNDLTAGFWGRMKDILSLAADEEEDDDGETIIRNRRLTISDSIAFSTIKATSDQNAKDISQVHQATPKDSKLSALIALLAQRNKDSDKKLAKKHEILNAIYASAKGFLLSAGVAKLSVITGQPWIMSAYIGYNSAKAINGLYKEYKQYNKVTNKNFRQFWRENPVRVTTTLASPFLIACGFSEARIANAAAAGITSALSEWKKGNKGVAVFRGLSTFAGVIVGMHGANVQENSATSENTESNLANHNITPEVQTQDVANTENYTQNINTSDETTSSLTSENVSTDTSVTEQTSTAQNDTSQKVEQQTVQNAETAQEETAQPVQAQEQAAAEKAAAEQAAAEQAEAEQAAAEKAAAEKAVAEQAAAEQAAAEQAAAEQAAAEQAAAEQAAAEQAAAEEAAAEQAAAEQAAAEQAAAEQAAAEEAAPVETQEESAPVETQEEVTTEQEDNDFPTPAEEGHAGDVLHTFTEGDTTISAYENSFSGVVKNEAGEVTQTWGIIMENGKPYGYIHTTSGEHRMTPQEIEHYNNLSADALLKSSNTAEQKIADLYVKINSYIHPENNAENKIISNNDVAADSDSYSTSVNAEEGIVRATPPKELYASALSNAIEFGLEDAQTITVSDGPEKGYLVSKAENGWQVMKPDGNSVVLVKDENGAWKGSFVSSQGDVKDMSPKEVTNYRASAEGTFKSFHKVDTRGRP